MSEKKVAPLPLEEQLEEALRRNLLLQEELRATNSGLLALTMELEQKNEEVQAISQQLWQMDKMATLGELAASIAHELNNPLTTISLRLESLADQIPPDDVMQRPLCIISREVDRMATLVKNLLEYTRSGQQEVCAVDICQEIDYSLELIHYHFRKNRINVRREFQPGLPQLYAERHELQQLFLNLCTNASDAMPGGGSLTIRVYAEHTETDCIAVDFADTGLGIQPDDLARVMEPFYTTKAKGEGTGLGLSICRRIVQERHGGSITISSQVGQGTTVSLKLPVNYGMS